MATPCIPTIILSAPGTNVSIHVKIVPIQIAIIVFNHPGQEGIRFLIISVNPTVHVAILNTSLILPPFQYLQTPMTYPLRDM